MRGGTIERFWRARQGNVAIIVALALPFLALIVGGGLDMQRAMNGKATVQAASDAATLAAARAYFGNISLTPAQREQRAKDAATTMLAAHVKSDDNLQIDNWSMSVDTEASEITVNIAGGTTNIFAGLLGFPRTPFNVTTSAAVGGREMEIALILDNTSSMFESNRFTVMREAAKQYVNDVYNLGGDRVRVSVVPWTTLVNINSEAPAAADASAAAVGAVPNAGSRRMPLNAASSRLGVLGQPRNATIAVTQSDLAALAAPVGWRGCVRSSNGEVTVDSSGKVTKPITDAAPSTRFPAAILESSLSQRPQRTYCTAWHTETYTPATGGGGGGGGGGGSAPGMQGSIDGLYGGQVMRAAWTDGSAEQWFEQQGLWTPAATRTVCDVADKTSPLRTCLNDGSTSWHANGTRNAYYATTEACTNTSYWTATAPIEDKTRSPNRPCIADPNEIAYVAGGGRICKWEQNAFTGFNNTSWSANAAWTAQVPISGPNINCPVSILPLSSNRKQVLDKLNEMYPVPGGTMADVGILWGLRTLAPGGYWPKFWGLSGAQEPKPWKDAKTSKMAIVLTDGKNLAPTQYEGYYGCTDTGRGGAAGNCWKSPNVAKLNDAAVNNLTLSACKQLRETYGVDLYFILVDVDDASAKQIAQDCAPDPDHAISTSSGQLSEVFKGLVATSLRISH